MISWIQLLLLVGLMLAATKPLGIYCLRVLDPDQRGGTFLDPVLGPLERLLYRLLGIDRRKEQNWKQYSLALLAFSFVSCLFTYGILRLQDKLPLNPQNLPAVPDHLALNTAVSFMCNTDWQSYGGEGVMSYFSQMVALTVHNFFSTAVGIAVAAALVRGIARVRVDVIGNFWVDLVRITLYLLLPVCLFYSLFLVSQGMIQNFRPYEVARVVDQSAAASPGQPLTQTIAQGPMASQAAIKMFGINGGGFTNVNSAHPFENPNGLSNFVQILSYLLIPTALTYYLGLMVKNQRHGWAVWMAMFLLLMAGILTCWWAEAAGNPQMHGIGIAAAGGNMEGKEVRFGIYNSALFTSTTTAIACGAVNCMHDSLTPIGGMVPLFNMHLGEVVFGGAGAGLYGVLVFVFVAIFIAGLMVGRTPEYLGKKIEAYDVKLASLALLVMTVFCLAFTAWAIVSDWGKATLNNSGPHGFSELLYAYSSAVANNGSAFGGVTANAWFNVTMAAAILLGRFMCIIPVLALAGALARKKVVAHSAGSFPVTGTTFIVLLMSIIVIVGALSFFPALALGPVVEHFLMKSGQVF